MRRPRELSAEEIRKCFEDAGIALPRIPTLDQCENARTLMPSHRADNPQPIGGAGMPHLAITASRQLLDALPGVKAYWRNHEEAAHANWKREVFDRLDRLQATLVDCQGLLSPSPDPFPESRDDAIEQLADVFDWAMAKASPGKKFGRRSRGPLTRFVSNALERLGYGIVSPDSLRQHFRGRAGKPSKK